MQTLFPSTGLCSTALIEISHKLGILVLPDELTSVCGPAAYDIVAFIIAHHQGLSAHDGPTSAPFVDFGFPKNLGADFSSRR